PRLFAVNNLFCHSSSLFLAGSFAGARENSENFVFAQNQIFIVVNFDFGPRILSKKYPVAFLHFERKHFPIFQALAGTHSNYFALLGLFLGCVGNDDPASNRFLFFDSFDQNTIMQRSYFHGLLSFCSFILLRLQRFVSSHSNRVLILLRRSTRVNRVTNYRGATALT